MRFVVQVARQRQCNAFFAAFFHHIPVEVVEAWLLDKLLPMEKKFNKAEYSARSMRLV